MKKLVYLLFFLSTSLSYSQKDTITALDSLLMRSKVKITIPNGFKKIDLESFRKAPHQLAIESNDAAFQIRFCISPLDKTVLDFNKKSKKEQKSIMQPNNYCKSMLMLSVLNVTNNKKQDYYVSPFLDITKKNYNADWEAFSLVENAWPQINYKYCYIVCLHKDDTADLYIYSFINNMNDTLKVIEYLTESIEYN